MRIPVAPTLGIERFSAGSISVPISHLKNGVFLTRSDGSAYITQRPSIDIADDASATVTDTDGRGVFYWESASALYFVNADTVYKADYSAPLGATMTAGTDRVYFFEVGDYLAILDPENDEGWTIAVGASTTLTAISDLDFPSSLAKGGAVLNGRLYVMDTNGVIYGCDSEDPTAWTATNYINAEIEPDGGVYLGKHQQHVVAMGTRTIEFFYDNANPTGSPLSARLDVSHEIGCANHDTVWGDQNRLYFVGQTATGGLAVYLLDAFMPVKISTPDLEALLTTAVQSDGVKLVGSGFSTGSGIFYALTIYNVSGSVSPLETVVFNPITKTWTRWELMHDGINNFPVMDWTVATSTRLGSGVLSNGDIITAGDDFLPTDRFSSSDGVYDAAPTGPYEADIYVSSTEGGEAVISMELITGDSDYGAAGTRKFMSGFHLAGPLTKTPQTLTVQWADEQNETYNAGTTIDTSVRNRRIARLGSFYRRNFKLTYAGNERWTPEGFEADVAGGAN